MDKAPNIITRRQFIRQAACAAVGTSAIASTLFDLRLINAVMAQGSPTDYKALVCVFLYGGNDANNLIIPNTGGDYTNYASIRQNLAIAQNALLGINPAVSDGHSYGLHPNCPELQTLFESNRLAILANVGTLVYPLTKAQFSSGSVPKPPQLFSHNDQQVQWQTSIPDQPTKTGWGGRCADLLYSLNQGAQVSMSISLSGFNTWEVGNIIQQYQVGTTGTIGLNNLSSAQFNAVTNILGLARTNIFEKTYAQTTETAIKNYQILSSLIPPGSLPGFPATSLGQQLQMIAKVISIRDALNMKRQIFFCSVGGYDTHGEQLVSQGSLLTELSQSLKAFYDYTVTLGIADKVTAFTASDFGRTFPSNGIGSDHGWGSHQLIVGGAVNGRRIIGKVPELVVNGPDDTGLGRWIPTTSVDEYSGTLAKWFGLSTTELTSVLPNLGHFDNPDLGFML